MSRLELLHTKHCGQCKKLVLPLFAKGNCGQPDCPFKAMPLHEHPHPIPCPRCRDNVFCGIFPEVKNDAGEQIAPRRLLCKWCGYCYASEYGLIQAEPDMEKQYWTLRGPIARWYTPKEMVELPSAHVEIRERLARHLNEAGE